MLLDSVEFSEAASEDARRASLCPRCAGRLPVETSRCENCRLPFKSRAEARKLGLLLPGGGYFYTRHPFLGIADAFVELVLLLAVVSGVSMAMQGEEGGMEALVTFSVVLFIEKFVSVYHSNHFVKEYITAEKNPVYYSPTAVG